MNFSEKSILSNSGNNLEVNLRLPTEEERNKFNNPPPYDQFLGGVGGMFYPNMFNIKAAQSLGLAGEEGYFDSYFYIQDLYRYISEALLYDNLNLARCDKMVEQAGILTSLEEDKVYYQRMNTMPTKYIYLRNNIYVERLSEDEIQVFFAAIDGDRAVIDDELIAIVERTMPIVLKKSISLDDTIIVSYGAPVPGPDELKNVANNTLLFEIAMRMEYVDEGWPEMESWNEKVDLLIDKVIPPIQMDVSEYNGMPVVFCVGAPRDTPQGGAL